MEKGTNTILKTWYMVETEDQGYKVKCKDIKTVKVAIETAEQRNIYIHELTVSEYEFDKTCAYSESLIDFCNAEIFVLDC